VEVEVAAAVAEILRGQQHLVTVARLLKECLLAKMGRDVPPTAEEVAQEVVGLGAAKVAL
jgi:hypothetical protein